MRARSLTGLEAIDFDYGQREDLRDRLKDLLEHSYRDGLSVPKELIQNADDAGASKVCFLLDERENPDCRQVAFRSDFDCRPYLFKMESSLQQYRHLFEALGVRDEFGVSDGIDVLGQGYTFDTSVLKELIQNADDAGATEIKFIKDFGQLKKEKIPYGWERLQVSKTPFKDASNIQLFLKFVKLDKEFLNKIEDPLELELSSRQLRQLGWKEHAPEDRVMEHTKNLCRALDKNEPQNSLAIQRYVKLLEQGRGLDDEEDADAEDEAPEATKTTENDL
nr:hypothetical protein BaRGS_009184 [Batillaria attramentaria]